MSAFHLHRLEGLTLLCACLIHFAATLELDVVDTRYRDDLKWVTNHTAVSPAWKAGNSKRNSWAGWKKKIREKWRGGLSFDSLFLQLPFLQSPLMVTLEVILPHVGSSVETFLNSKMIYNLMLYQKVLSWLQRFLIFHYHNVCGAYKSG